MTNKNVLVLNASYEPLNIARMEDAVLLKLKGRVEAVTDDVIEIKRPGGLIFELPRVLRLVKYINVPRRGSTWTRRGVFVRDGYRCIFCGHQVGDTVNGKTLKTSHFTLEHLLPRSRGGKSTWGNTACACQWCNRRKGNRLPHEASMPLLWEPKIPRGNVIVARGNIPSSWKIYFEDS